jgi:hypothetical protein
VLEVQPAREIKGELTLPPDPDLFFLTCALAVALDREAIIEPLGDAPLWSLWRHTLEPIADCRVEATRCMVKPRSGDGSSFVSLPYRMIPFRDLSVCLLAGAGKTVVLKGASDRRIDAFIQLGRRFDCAIERIECDGDPGVRLSAGASLRTPETISDPNAIHGFLGLAIGMHAAVETTLDFHLSSPLRAVLPAFGVEMTIRGNQPGRENDPLARRIRMMQVRKQGEMKQTFTLQADFARVEGDRAQVSLPGDGLLATLLYAAKSLIPKGACIVAHAPLETWHTSFLSFIRKMGCRYGIQETGDTSFGRVGMVQLQRFAIVGRKAPCTPLYHYFGQLPMMVVLSTFASGQSVFRNLEDLRLDTPDPIEEMLACVRLVGGRHGEMPDGMVIDGARQYDGFDLTDQLDASLSGACAIAGLRCTGTTTIADEAITVRWGDFSRILDAVCEFRA